jgi:hypothetical protein
MISRQAATLENVVSIEAHAVILRHLHMITESALRKHIKAFAATISHQELGLAHYRPEKWGQPTRCFENVARKVQEDAGRVQFGWMFHHRYVTDIPDSDYLIAAHHAVWHAPNGDLIDVTPFHPDAKHHPISPGGDVLFLVDSGAMPVITDRLMAPLPSKFSPVSNDERLLSHLQRLSREEEQHCRLIYEGKAFS